mmetsp:Transcript_21909/g.52129  ORF Transcript_21909/g.52129 Transcript_21909/m.52129 type:complete len:944 (-) Transcript_21909:389-3220(-)
MIERCTRHLSNISLFSLHIERPYCTRGGKGVFRFRRYNLYRRYQFVASLRSSEDRSSICGLSSLSTGSNYYHQKRFYGKISRLPNSAAYRFQFVRASSGGFVSLAKSDSFTMILDSFPTTIKKNVDDVISKVDSVSRPSMKGRLQKRWEGIVRREKENWRHRKINSRLNKAYPQDTKPLIEARWDESLRRHDYCIIPISSDFSAIDIDDKDEQSFAINLSPIFRFQLEGQQYSINSKAPLAIEGKEALNDLIDDDEVQCTIKNATEIEKEIWGTTDVHDAIIRSISLLTAMRTADWQKYDSNAQLSMEVRDVGKKNSVTKTNKLDKLGENLELMVHKTPPTQIHNSRTKTRRFLQHIIEHQYVLTTSLVNLLLAHLVSSTDSDHQELGGACLRIFDEMKTLSESGQHDCKPDSITYHILILAFSRRFQAMDEAIKLSHELAKSPSTDINPGLLNVALKACRAKTEHDVARLLMDSALSGNQNRLNVNSCILYTEILKDKRFDQEALNFFNRIKKANLLSSDDEDKYLIALCRWPKRSRKGDILDLSIFWIDILNLFEENMLSSKIPDIRVWITFLEGLHSSAKDDVSLWNTIARVVRRVLDSYPQILVGSKLMTIGLDASFCIQDPKLASLVLERIAQEPFTSSNPSNSNVDDSGRSMHQAKVPFRLLKKSLEMCLRTLDTNSAQSIRKSLDKIGDPYPLGAKSELYTLVLICHAKGNNAETAKKYLQMMIENNMKPSEELFSEVIYAMAAECKYQESEELFESMQKEIEDRMKPTITSYDAILHARVKGKDWDGVISLYDEMKNKGIDPTSRTIKGLIVANNEKGGRKSVLSVLKSLLLCNAQFDESAFRAASKTLYKDVDENLDDFCKTVQQIGELKENLRNPSRDLLRSIRSAESESNRQKNLQDSNYERKYPSEDAWRIATSHLLVFVQVWLKSENDVI